MDEALSFTRARLSWNDTFQVGGLRLSKSDIVQSLAPHLTDERKLRLAHVVAQRSRRVVSVLENIYDHGNVSAVMRSSEAFGFVGLNLVDLPGARFKAANRVTRGADKWLDVRSFGEPTLAVQALRAEGYQIWATDLDTEHSIETLDWSRPLAFVLGNEKDGVSPDMLAQVDGRFRIPMAGFSQSFNISVAAALIFYHAHQQMQKLGDAAHLSANEAQQVLANYYLRCFDNPEQLLRAKGFT